MWGLECFVCEDSVLRWVAMSSKSLRGLLIFRPGHERRWAVNKESRSESRFTASSKTDSWAEGNYYKTSDFTGEPVPRRLCVTFNLSRRNAKKGWVRECTGLKENKISKDFLKENDSCLDGIAFDHILWLKPQIYCITCLYNSRNYSGINHEQYSVKRLTLMKFIIKKQYACRQMCSSWKTTVKFLL